MVSSFAVSLVLTIGLSLGSSLPKLASRDTNDDDYQYMLDKYEVRSEDEESEEMFALIETEDLVGLDEDIEEDEEDGDEGSDLPEELDWRGSGVVHEAIDQGACGSCGWVSGTQTLEARLALVSENHVPLSIQNFMNCAKEICVGELPYGVFTRARKTEFVVRENQLTYTKKECLDWGPKKTGCKCGADHPNEYNNEWDNQFVVICGTRSAHTEAHLKRALQSGPVTTSFNFVNKAERDLYGERCTYGGKHANSVIGYTKDKFILQDSYGTPKTQKGFLNTDGSWETTMGSRCAEAVISKAYYPFILYDYDRTNAYFEEIELVEETTVVFVDKPRYRISPDDTKNVGRAKNKCAFLGSACKGVVALSNGVFELVSTFGDGVSGTQKAFSKVQMVVYLKHEDTGMYIGIDKTEEGLALVSTEKEDAAPFFTSYGRFISFEYPTYHMAGNTLVEMSGLVRDIDKLKTWTLKNCILHNRVSGKALDIAELLMDVGKKIKKVKKVYHTTTGKPMDKTVSTQRFDLGISGKWPLTSTELGLMIGSVNDVQRFVDLEEKKKKVFEFRWMARQIMHHKLAKALDQNMEFSTTDFDIKDISNVINPTDCIISTLGSDEKLSLVNGQIELSSDMGSGWTFEYGDL